MNPHNTFHTNTLLLFPFIDEKRGLERLSTLKGKWGNWTGARQSDSRAHTLYMLPHTAVIGAVWEFLLCEFLRLYVFGYPVMLIQSLAQRRCLNLSKSDLVWFYIFLDRSLWLTFPCMLSLSTLSLIQKKKKRI